MGIFRLFLAINVVIGHSTALFGFTFIGSEHAVQIFFMISGFYMALVLTEKYHVDNNYWLFLSNRLLKIFPMYFVVILLTVIISVLSGVWVDSWLRLEPYIDHINAMATETLLYLGFSNLFILGQDIGLFLGLDYLQGELYFSENFRLTESPRVHHYMLVPQAWSLSLELMFYCLIPFFYTVRSVWITCFILLILAIKIYITTYGYDFDPWTRRLFPLEIIYFMLGLLSYRIYKNIHLGWVKTITLSAALVSIIFVLSYQFISFDFKNSILILCMLLAIPYIFYYSRNSHIDRKIGELSYPLYIVHILVIMCLALFEIKNAMIVIVISIILSYFLYWFPGVHIERFRQRRVIDQS